MLAAPSRAGEKEGAAASAAAEAHLLASTQSANELALAAAPYRLASWRSSIPQLVEVSNKLTLLEEEQLSHLRDEEALRLLAGKIRVLPT